jgi:hypothetical protein
MSIKQLVGTPAVSIAQGLFEEKSTPQHVIGETIFSNDGRAFRYGKAGGTALVVGKLQQSSAQDTGDQNLAIAAASVGATQIVTTGTVTVTENQYAGGFASITVTPGVGYLYPISGHLAATAAVVTINLAAQIDVALTTSSKVDLIKNPYDGVIVNPTTLTSAPVGVAVKALTATYFGWLQVSGPANLLSDGGFTVGLDIVASDNVAGAGEVIADGTAELLPKVATAITTVADTEYGAVFLKML